MSQSKENRLYTFSRVWDKDLADLYYYSLSFDNIKQAKSIAVEWKERYQDITSLFYYGVKENDPLSVNFVPFDVLSHSANLKLNKFTPEHFDFLIELGLQVKNYNLFIFNAVRENNTVFWDYFYTKYINTINPEIENHKKILLHALRLCTNNETPCMFNNLTLKAKEFFPLGIIYTCALGNSLARDNTALTEHIKKVSNISYLSLLGYLEQILLKNKDEFLIISKRASLGSYEQMKKIILSE